MENNTRKLFSFYIDSKDHEALKEISKKEDRAIAKIARRAIKKEIEVCNG